MFPWQTQLFVARPRPIRRREFHVCHERYAILMSQGKTYTRVLRLLLELAFTSGRDDSYSELNTSKLNIFIISLRDQVTRRVIFYRVEHIDHVEFLATKITKGTKVFNAESQRRRERREDFWAGALPQTPNNVESRMISSHSGYGVKPHLQIFYMIYMFYTVK